MNSIPPQQKKSDQLQTKIIYFINRFKFTTGFLVFSILAVFFVFYKYGLLQRFVLEQKKEVVEAEVVRAKFVEDSLRGYIKILTYDTLEIEKIAREQYGMIRQNEEVIYVKMTEDKSDTTSSVE
jgi:cell division protein FtsB